MSSPLACYDRCGRGGATLRRYNRRQGRAAGCKWTPSRHQWQPWTAELQCVGVRSRSQTRTAVPRCARDAEWPGSLIAPVQGARVSQRVFSLRDVITSASLRKRRGDTLVSLCESRFPLPRAVPAVCQLAACDAGLLRGDVGRAARKKMVCHGRAIVAVEKSIEAAGARSDARRRVRSRGARRAEGRTELRHVRRRPALNRTSDRRDRRGACVGLPTTTQDQPALSYKAIKLAGTTDHFDAPRRFIAVR